MVQNEAKIKTPSDYSLQFFIRWDNTPVCFNQGVALTHSSLPPDDYLNSLIDKRNTNLGTLNCLPIYDTVLGYDKIPLAGLS